MKRLLLSLLVVVSATGALAQEAAETIRTKYTSYRSKISSTKTYTVFPQDKYSPGDTAFFAAYFLTEKGAFVSGSQIIRVALIDDTGNTILRQLISTEDGVGRNQLVLPADLKEGYYFVITYSDYMKSSDTRFYSRKLIEVVGKNSILPKAPSSGTVAAEGGHFIAGVGNRVGFVVPGAVQRKLIVKDARGTSIAQTTTDTFGTASLLITPSEGETYTATVDDLVIPFPAVEAAGCAIQLSPLYSRGQLNMSVDAPRESIWRGRPIIVVVTLDGELAYTATTRLAATGPTMIRLPSLDLPNGLAEIDLLSSDGNLLASRLFYSNSGPLVTCDLQLSAPVAGKRRAEITITDRNGTPIQSRFTASAINATILPQARELNPDQTLNLVTEIDAASAAHAGHREWPQALDNWMLTQKALIPWESILHKQEPQLKSPPRFVAARGRVFFASTGKPVPDSTKVCAYLKNNRYAFESITGKGGDLDIAFLSLDGADELFYFAESNGQELDDVKIEWIHDVLPFRAVASATSSVADPYATFMTRKKAIDRSFGFFSSPPRRNEEEIFESSLEGDLRNTGTTVNVQDFRLFPTMPELLREIIPNLYHRRQGGKDIVRVRFNDAMIQPSTSPLYIINGVMTRSTPTFLALDPADVVTIKVVFDPQELSRFRPVTTNGVVIVKTRKKVVIADDSRILIDGIMPSIPFSPVAERPAISNRKPEFRSTVYWNPDVRTDKNGKATIEFVTSDDEAPLRITIRGVIGGQAFEVVKLVPALLK